MLSSSGCRRVRELPKKFICPSLLDFNIHPHLRLQSTHSFTCLILHVIVFEFGDNLDHVHISGQPSFYSHPRGFPVLRCGRSVHSGCESAAERTAGGVESRDEGSGGVKTTRVATGHNILTQAYKNYQTRAAAQLRPKPSPRPNSHHSTDTNPNPQSPIPSRALPPIPVGWLRPRLSIHPHHPSIPSHLLAAEN